MQMPNDVHANMYMSTKNPPARDLPGPPEMGGTSYERSTRSASFGL